MSSSDSVAQPLSRPKPAKTSRPGALAAAWLDLVRGFKRARLWSNLAGDDIRTRYMRSFAGISWIFISFAFFIFVKTVIFAAISNEDITFFAPYVTLGFFVWAFIRSTITEGCMTFIGARGWLQSEAVPLSTFVYRTVTRNLFITAMHAIVVLVVLVGTRLTPTPTAWLIVPMSILIVLNAVWVTLFVGIIGTRFRDFIHLVSTMMRVMVFMTPIFWMPEQLGALWNVLIFNPVAHFIFVIRDPLQFGTIPTLSIIVVCSITVVGWLITLGAFAYARRRLIFWL